MHVAFPEASLLNVSDMIHPSIQHKTMTPSIACNLNSLLY